MKRPVGLILMVSLLVGCVAVPVAHRRAGPSSPKAVEMTALAGHWPTEGWSISTPEAQGMDSWLLAGMFEAIRERGYAVDSVTVVRNGTIVADATVYPFTPGSRHVIHSCTKSIVSALIGVAIDQGYVDGLEQRILDIFSERRVASVDVEKEAMTLEHVLTMASGLECRDSYLYRWRGLREMRQSDDWVQFVLDLPMAEPPGTRFEYCNGGSFLLAAIIQEATGASAAAFAEKHLFGPLGIRDVIWSANPEGISIGWGELQMRPHDMAKIGYLYLNEGRWNGEQVVPAEWVRASTRKRISATLQDGYGYQWWVRGDGTYMALGYAGQYIVVVPDLELVVVFTSDLAEEDFYVPQELLDAFIIPAAASRGRLPANPDGQAQLEAAIMALAAPRAAPTEAPRATSAPSSVPTDTATPTLTSLPPTATPVPPTPTPRPATHTICAAGCDFSTIQAAIDSPATQVDAIIEVTDPVHTEAGIVFGPGVTVTVRGLGAKETVVQAHETLEDSPERVFFVEEGAVVTLEKMTIQHGRPSVVDEHGGGIDNHGTVVIRNCVVTRNSAGGGGGICNWGDLKLIDSTVSNNACFEKWPTTRACGSGGGIKLVKGARLNMVGSTVSDNEARSHGGGVFVACETRASLTDSTISGNRATTWGGGLYTKSLLHLNHCTVVGNYAKATCALGQMARRCPQGEGGGGVYVRHTLHFTDTLIANNGREDCALAPAGTYGMLESGKIGANVNNLVGDGTCDAAHTGDPLLGPLLDNGGATLTHALLPGSPAIDAVPMVSCNFPTDQRGAMRPVVQTSAETPCDIGALEVPAATETTPVSNRPAGDTWARPADGMTMVYVPAGEFVQSSDRDAVEYARNLCKAYAGDLVLILCVYETYQDERPAHSAALDGFWIDRTEVTNGQYRRCEEAGRCTAPEESGSLTRDTYYGDSAYADYPVVWVTWQQASDCCAWAGVRLATAADKCGPTADRCQNAKGAI